MAKLYGTSWNYCWWWNRLYAEVVSYKKKKGVKIKCSWALNIYLWGQEAKKVRKTARRLKAGPFIGPPALSPNQPFSGFLSSQDPHVTVDGALPDLTMGEPQHSPAVEL